MFKTTWKLDASSVPSELSLLLGNVVCCFSKKARASNL